MPLSRIALGVVSAAVLVVLAVLYVQVRSGPAEADHAQVAAAQARVGAHGNETQVPLDGEGAAADPWKRPARPPRAAAAEAEPVRQLRPAIADAPDVVVPELPGPTRATPADDEVVPQAGEPVGELTLADRKLQANHLYDKGEYEDAQKLALDLLREEPGGIGLLRVVVSSACQMGDEALARTYFAQLKKPRDQATMIARCAKSNIALTPSR